MLRREAAGPVPPSRRRFERELDAHVEALIARQAVDPFNRRPFGPLLDARRAWLLASRPDDDAGPAGIAGAALLPVVVITLLGDVATLYVSLSVLGNASAPVSAFLAVTLGVLATALAHEVGRWFGRRGRPGPGTPGVLALLAAVVWLAVGVVAALLRVAAPVVPAGGFAGGSPPGVAVSYLLAGLLFVLYAGNFVAAAAHGVRTAEAPGVLAAVACWLRARRTRRRRVAVARIVAHLADREADAMLRVARAEGNPMATDVLTAASVPLGRCPTPEGS